MGVLLSVLWRGLRGPSWRPWGCWRAPGSGGYSMGVLLSVLWRGLRGPTWLRGLVGSPWWRPWKSLMVWMWLLILIWRTISDTPILTGVTFHHHSTWMGRLLLLLKALL